MINSTTTTTKTTTLDTDSDKHLCISIGKMNHNQLDNMNNNYKSEKSLFDCNNTKKQNHLSLNDNENDTSLLTTTTTTTTVEVKVKTTKTSSRKRKLNIINDINKAQVNTKKKV